MDIEVFYGDVAVIFLDCYALHDGDDWYLEYNKLDKELTDDLHDEIIGLLEDEDVYGMMSFMHERSEYGTGWFEKSYKEFWILSTSRVMIELD